MNEKTTMTLLLRDVDRLLDMLDASDAAELEWEHEGCTVRIARSFTRACVIATSPRSAESGPGEKEKRVRIVSNVVGLFHFPETVPHVGASVIPGEVLGYVDSVSVKHPVEAQATGRLAEIHVREGQAVEFGQLLFSLE